MRKKLLITFVIIVLLLFTIVFFVQINIFLYTSIIIMERPVLQGSTEMAVTLFW